MQFRNTTMTRWIILEFIIQDNPFQDVYEVNFKIILMILDSGLNSGFSKKKFYQRRTYISGGGIS